MPPSPPLPRASFSSDSQAFSDAHFAKGVGGLVVSIVGTMLPVLLVPFLYEPKIFIRL